MADLDLHLEAIAAGDPDAFARWVVGAEPRVRASLSSFAAQVDTEAVVQETLLRMWQVAPRVKTDGKGDSLLRLAIRSARNLAIDHLRRARTRPTEIEAIERREWVDPAPPDPLLRRLIHACLEKLPGKPRAAITARLTASGARPDVVLCDEVGMTLNTFLVNVRRARLAVAKCLEAGGAKLPEVPR